VKVAVTLDKKFRVVCIAPYFFPVDGGKNFFRSLGLGVLDGGKTFQIFFQTLRFTA